MIDVDVRSPTFARIVPRDARLDVVAHGHLFAEGPVWVRAEGALYWVDILGDTIYRWRPGIGRDVVMCPSGKANGMTLDAAGRRVVAGWSSRSIWRVEPDGSIVTLADEFDGKRLNTPNDVIVGADGAIYWTDCSGALFIPGMDGEDVQRYIDNHPVFRLSPDERTVTMVTGTMAYPNGLAFSPDESVLYVSDTYEACVRAFPVDEGGEISPYGEVLYALVGDEPGVADGLKVDQEGNVYVTGPAGVHVVRPDGTLLGRLRIPGHTTNMAWGDADLRTLFITTYSTVYRVRLGIPGVPLPPERR